MEKSFLSLAIFFATFAALATIGVSAQADESFKAEWCNSNVRMYLPDESVSKTGEVCYGSITYQGDIAVRTVKIVEEGSTSYLYHGHVYPWTRISSKAIFYKYVSSLSDQSAKPVDVVLTWSDSGDVVEVFGNTPRGFQFIAKAP